MSIFNRKRDDLWDPFGDWEPNLPFGNSFFGGLTSPFARMFADFENVFELAEQGKLPQPGEGGPYIYARSTYVGPDGVPHTKEVKNFSGQMPVWPGLGSLGGTGPKALTEGAQHPHYELQTGPKTLTVTVELPGLTKEQLELETSETSLTLKGEAGEGGRNYTLDLELPAKVKPNKTKARFTNGILEVTLPLAKPAEEGRKVKID